jgi:hypothetical protein
MERQKGPQFLRARGDDVGVAEEPEGGAVGAGSYMGEKDVAYIAAEEPFHVESKRQQALGYQALASCVIRRNRRPGC